MKHTTLMIGFLSMLVLFGCLQTNENASLTISQLNMNPDRYVGQTITVNGYLQESACTLMACIPEQACCNQCSATLREFDFDKSPNIQISGLDCAFSQLEKIKEKGSRVSVTGVWTKQSPIGDGLTAYFLVLQKRDSTNPLISFNELITLQEGKIYNLQDHSHVSIIVNDSRCQPGVQCIWEGELSVTVYLDGIYCGPACDPLPREEVTLSERNKNATIPMRNFTITLQSINIEQKEAVIQIVENNTIPVEELVWFSFIPQQCNQNPWNEWDEKTGYSQTIRFSSPEAMERAIITAWLESEGVKVLDYAFQNTREVVCLACNCPSGREIAVLVDQMYASQMNKLGFIQLTPSGCTEEAMMCSDGVTYVSRTGPWCQFEACPEVLVNLDVNTDTVIEIIKTDYPGFQLNPVTTIVRINSDGNGSIISESFLPSIQELSDQPEDYNGQMVTVTGWLSSVACTKMACEPSNPCCNQCNGTLGYSGLPASIAVSGNSCDLVSSNGTTTLTGTFTQVENKSYQLNVTKREEKKFQVSRATLELMAQKAIDEKFFSLNQHDIQMCLADGATKGIKVTVNRFSNEIMQIGAECDQTQTALVRELIEQVEALSAGAQ